jgi:hypothetical protein
LHPLRGGEIEEKITPLSVLLSQHTILLLVLVHDGTQDIVMPFDVGILLGRVRDVCVRPRGTV